MGDSGIIGKHFDNMLRYYKAEIAAPNTTVVTEQIDLDTPKGYVYKIRKVIVECHTYGAGNDGDQKEHRGKFVLLRDPDDSTTIDPDAVADNDVIVAGEFGGQIHLTTSGQIWVIFPDKYYDFPEPLDQIGVRPMRFNGRSENTDAGMNFIVNIWYTMEELSERLSTDLLAELLGII